MNFLILIFKVLFLVDLFVKGIFNVVKIKFLRKIVNVDVKNYYDYDKDFFILFLKSYVVEV